MFQNKENPQYIGTLRTHTTECVSKTNMCSVYKTGNMWYAIRKCGVIADLYLGKTLLKDMAFRLLSSFMRSHDEVYFV